MRRAVANAAAAFFLEGEMIGSETASTNRETFRRHGRWSLRQLLERQSSLGIILMLPGAILLMVFMAYPFFLGIWLSLTDSVIGTLGKFIGLRNFSDLITDSVFRQTARNTFVYAMVTVPFKAILGLGMALILNNRLRFS